MYSDAQTLAITDSNRWIGAKDFKAVEKIVEDFINRDKARGNFVTRDKKNNKIDEYTFKNQHEIRRCLRHTIKEIRRRVNVDKFASVDFFETIYDYEGSDDES